MLFSQMKLNSKISLKNRMAVAPMTTQQSNHDGTISKSEADWLVRLSEDGYGMVISCAASISATATAFYNQLSIAEDMFVPGLQAVAKDMKGNGSLNIIQLCHGGSRAIEPLTGQMPKSASSYHIEIPGFAPPAALTIDQIGVIVADFALACRRVQLAGFDGVELHGANGYLFTQFISKMTNLRQDEYGGSLEGRARFSREVVQACRQVVTDDFIIGIRLSFEGMGLETGLDIDENIQITNWLAEDGIDYIHSSQLKYNVKSVKYADQTAVGYIRSGVVQHLPLVVAGGILTAADAINALALGADIVAVGRAAIGNRNVPQYFKDNIDLPAHTPYATAELQKIGISNAFIDYCKNAAPLKSLNIVQ
jgi:2,4-dienoyl-CoA reductase-like NADH-dependent reductase (Old Yellow Enzyme family)